MGDRGVIHRNLRIRLDERHQSLKAIFELMACGLCDSIGSEDFLPGSSVELTVFCAVDDALLVARMLEPRIRELRRRLPPGWHAFEVRARNPDATWRVGIGVEWSA